VSEKNIFLWVEENKSANDSLSIMNPKMVSIMDQVTNNLVLKQRRYFGYQCWLLLQFIEPVLNHNTLLTMHSINTFADEHDAKICTRKGRDVERLYNYLRRFCIPVVFSTSPQSTAAMLPIYKF
ncbi:hypothetical protein L9F63_011880, partial [Diploptera punctata]